MRHLVIVFRNGVGYGSEQLKPVHCTAELIVITANVNGEEMRSPTKDTIGGLVSGYFPNTLKLKYNSPNGFSQVIQVCRS